MNAWKQHVEYVYAIQAYEKRLDRKEGEILAYQEVRPVDFPFPSRQPAMPCVCPFF